MHSTDMGKEFDIIQRITEKFSKNQHVLIGPGDDAAVLDISGQRIVVCTDMMVENVHFKTTWLTPLELGMRIVAQNFADIVAMAATPIAVTANVSAPKETSTSWFEAIAVGMQAECDKLGASVIGGDLSTSNEITISVTALGTLSTSPVLRSGAKKDQIVALAGTLGHSAAGLACLQHGSTSPQNYVQKFRVPTPPYASGIRAGGVASSMIDISDGLVSDALHIATASGVEIHFDSDCIADSELEALASAMSEDVMSWILHGGEEHCLLATFDQGVDLPEGFRAIGHTKEGSPSVFLDGKALEPRGFTHF